ncbi:MAG: preprotein translocase subunit SecE [Bacilli bacterium]
MSKIVDYFKGVRKEISRIKWTSKKDLLKYSISTIVFMLFFGVFFYAIDLLVALLRSNL